VPISGEESLSPIQKDTLFSSIVTMCDAYSRGTYDAYKKFRIPKGFLMNSVKQSGRKSRWIGINLIRNLLQMRFQTIWNCFDGTFLHRAREHVIKIIGKRFAWIAAMFIKKLGTKSLLDQEARAGIYVSRDFLWNMNNGAGTFNNMFTALGILNVGPFFRFYPNGTEDLNSFATEKVLSVSLYFFVKPSPPEPVISLAVQWVWDEQTTQWIPMSMVRGDWMAMENPEFSNPGRSFVF
jgi:hypothetical protein